MIATTSLTGDQSSVNRNEPCDSSNNRLRHIPAAKRIKIINAIANRFRGQLPLRKGYRAELSSLELGLKSSKYGQIAIYSSRYDQLTQAAKEWLRNEKVELRTKLVWLTKAKAFPVPYFSEHKLEECRFKSFDALKGRIENCVIVKDKQIYVCRKNRCFGSVGGGGGDLYKCHTSMSHGGPVDFAGMLSKDGGKWILSNSSGHYAPCFANMGVGLKAFRDHGISLKNVMVKHMIFAGKERPNEENNRDYSVLVSHSFTIKKEGTAFFFVKTTEATEWIQQTSQLKSSPTIHDDYVIS